MSSQKDKAKTVVARQESRALRERSEGVGQLLSAFESETAAVFLRTTPKRAHSVLHILAAMLVLMIFLAAVVKLDRVVAGSGRITPVNGAIYISPLNSGIVREVNVKVGDVVRKGQALARLDPTASRADFLQVKQRLESAKAQAERLEAEHDDKPYAPKTLNEYSKVQMAIWKQRQAEYRSSLANLDGQIRNAQATVAQYQRDIQQYSKREQLANDLLGMYQPLLESGDVSRLQYMSAKDSHEEVKRLLSDSQGQSQATAQTLLAVQAQKQAYIEKWHADAGQQLVQTRSEVQDATQLLDKANLANDLSTITAPADGVVLRIGKLSVGSVAVSPNDNNLQEPLITLVPADAPLEVEIHVASQYIGFIRTGDKARLKLDAFPFLRHGTAEGAVTTISEGSFTVDDNGQPSEPYFRVRLAITAANLKNVPESFRLVPGMTLTGDILVGRRTILSYLVEGALRTGAEAMREPG